MGPVIPFIPYIIQGAGALGGMIAGRKAGGASKEEQQLAAGGQNVAGNLSQIGQDSQAQAKPMLDSAASYYMKLLTGNRNAINTALQPERTSISQAYRGGEKAIDRSGVLGAQRDVAKAELARERAGQIGGLAAKARPIAAERIGAMGDAAAGRAIQAHGGAGGLYGQLLNNATAGRQISNQAGSEFGSGIGTLLGQVMKETKLGKAGSKSGSGGGLGPGGSILEEHMH